MTRLSLLGEASIQYPVSPTEYSLKLWVNAWSSYLRALKINANRKTREEYEIKGLPTSDEFIVSFSWYFQT